MSYIEREAAYTLAKKIVDAVHSGEYSSIQLPHMCNLCWLNWLKQEVAE